MFPEKLSGTETCGRDPPSIIIEIIISFPHLQSPRSNQQEKGPGHVLPWIWRWTDDSHQDSQNTTIIKTIERLGPAWDSVSKA